MKKLLFRVVKSILYIALHYPLLWFLFFYSYVIRTRYVLDRWPSYNNPDPKSLGFDKHYNFVGNASNYILYSLVFVLTYSIICLINKKNIFKINKLNFYLFFIYFIIIFFWLSVADSPWWFLD